MVACVGLASGLGAGNRNCGKGPEFLKNNSYSNDLSK